MTSSCMWWVCARTRARKENKQGDGAGRCTGEPLEVLPQGIHNLWKSKSGRNAQGHGHGAPATGMSISLLLFTDLPEGTSSDPVRSVSPPPSVHREGLAKVTSGLGVTESKGYAVLQEMPTPPPGHRAPGSYPARPVAPTLGRCSLCPQLFPPSARGVSAPTTVPTLTSPRLIYSTSHHRGAPRSWSPN